jgi:hypothetical protein
MKSPVRAAVCFAVAGLLALCAAGAAAAQTPPQDNPASAVSLKRVLVVASSADPQAGQLVVLEKLHLQNDGAGPYVPSRWEESALRFRFPAGAQRITLDMGPPGAALAPSGEALVLAAPLPAGEQSLVVSYTLPYATTGGAGTLRVGHSLAMPVESWALLAPAVDGLVVQPLTPGLVAAEPVFIGGQRYLVLENARLAAGAELVYEYRGLPAAGTAGAGWPGTAPAPTAPAPGDTLSESALLVASGLILAGGLVYALGRGAPAAAGQPPSPARSGRALRAGRARLVDLAARFDAGELSRETYQVARWRLKAQLASLAQACPPGTAEPAEQPPLAERLRPAGRRRPPAAAGGGWPP